MTAQFIYRLTLTRPELLTEGPDEREGAIASRHSDYLQRLADDGVLIMAGRTQTDDPGTYGIAIIEAEDESKAREIMLSDPAVAEGLMTAELRPYRVAYARGT